jgi:hypothetical protein
MAMSEQEAKQHQEDWMVKKWRPAMGWTYMGICILDMAIFPVLWSVAQLLTKQPITQWNPLTLQGAGLFHLAMGAVLGIAAWSRGQEKMAGASGAPTVPSMPSMSSPPPMMSAPSMVPPMPPSLPADPSAVPKGRMKIED